MNIFDNKQAYVGCAFLIVGLVLQFFVGDLGAWIVGSLLIAFAPYGQYGHKKAKKPSKPYKTLNERKDDPEYTEKWCNITHKQLTDYVDCINVYGKSGSSFIRYFCGSRSLSRIIWAVFAVLAGMSLAGEGSYQSAAIAFDSYFLLKLIANLYNGPDLDESVKVPPNFAVNVEGAESILKIEHNEELFALQPQAFMRNDNGEISMRDFRFNIVPKQRIPGLLCSMVAMTVNNVRYLSYPYHYLVFVFKGTELAGNENFKSAIDTIASDRAERRKIDPDDIDALDEFDSSTHFKLDVKTDGGNSIFVILKSENSFEAYTTSEKDCALLMNVALKIMTCFEVNRDIITNSCK